MEAAVGAETVEISVKTISVSNSDAITGARRTDSFQKSSLEVFLFALAHLSLLASLKRVKS